MYVFNSIGSNDPVPLSLLCLLLYIWETWIISIYGTITLVKAEQRQAGSLAKSWFKIFTQMNCKLLLKNQAEIQPIGDYDKNYTFVKGISSLVLIGCQLKWAIALLEN